ncbi:MAG: hypothetical protein V3V05_04175 [Pontiella sp.]
MKSINELFTPYAQLETKVRGLMAQLFSNTCGMCTACCCRVDICEEAIQSAFLSQLLKKQGLSEKDMDDRIGWLDLSGCSLEYGKPPICYAYFCDQLLSRLPDDDTRYATSVLGKLMHHIGQNALNDLHLVEIRNQDDLEKADLTDVFHRLEEAQEAHQVLEQFVQSGRLVKSDHEILSKITTEDP